MSQTIFVLEDDADISRLVRYHLESAGYTVRPYLAIGGIMVVVPTRDLDAAIFLVGDPAEMPSPPRNFRGGWLRNALLVMLLWFFIGLYLPARARGCYARTEAA